MLRVIEQGQRTGAVVSGEPRELAVAAWSLVHGLASLLLDGPLPIPAHARTAPDGEAEDLIRAVPDLFSSLVAAAARAPGPRTRPRR